MKEGPPRQREQPTETEADDVPLGKSVISVSASACLALHNGRGPGQQSKTHVVR